MTSATASASCGRMAGAMGGRRCCFWTPCWPGGAGRKGGRGWAGAMPPVTSPKTVTAEAARLGIAIVNLPGYSPDLNPIERLWDWMREEVTRGFCHQSVPDLIAACQAFIARINRDPIALIDRLWPKFELDPEFEA